MDTQLLIAARMALAALHPQATEQMREQADRALATALTAALAARTVLYQYVAQLGHTQGEDDWFIHQQPSGPLVLGVLRLVGDTDRPTFYQIAIIEDNEEEAYNAALLCAAPRLLRALLDLARRCDGTEGVRADGSNIQTMQAHAALQQATTPWTPDPRDPPYEY